MERGKEHEALQEEAPLPPPPSGPPPPPPPLRGPAAAVTGGGVASRYALPGAFAPQPSVAGALAGAQGRPSLGVSPALSDAAPAGAFGMPASAAGSVPGGWGPGGVGQGMVPMARERSTAPGTLSSTAHVCGPPAPVRAGTGFDPGADGQDVSLEDVPLG